MVHLHALRKTFQTMGVQAGINQRAAQEFLGHSDANLTAKIYTDVPALGLRAEMEKLEWWEKKEGDENSKSLQGVTKTLKNAPLIEQLKNLVSTLEVLDSKGLQTQPTVSQLAARHGFEHALAVFEKNIGEQLANCDSAIDTRGSHKNGVPS